LPAQYETAGYYLHQQLQGKQKIRHLPARREDGD